MRVWRNAILNFGMVYVPVGVAKSADRKDVTFKTLHVDCGTPISQEVHCKECDMSLSSDDIVKGFETGKNQYVHIDMDELNLLKNQRSSQIVLDKFVARDEVSPLLIDKSYFLIPHQMLHRPYEILSGALSDKSFSGIGKANLAGKEYPVAVESDQGVLMLRILYCYDEVMSPAEIVSTLQWDVSDEERDMAGQFLEIKRGVLEAADLTSQTREVTMAYVEAKANGQAVVVPEPEPEPQHTLNALDALKLSLAEVGA